MSLSQEESSVSTPISPFVLADKLEADDPSPSPPPRPEPKNRLKRPRTPDVALSDVNPLDMDDIKPGGAAVFQAMQKRLKYMEVGLQRYRTTPRADVPS